MNPKITRGIPVLVSGLLFATGCLDRSGQMNSWKADLAIVESQALTSPEEVSQVLARLENSVSGERPNQNYMDRIREVAGHLDRQRPVPVYALKGLAKIWFEQARGLGNQPLNERYRGQLLQMVKYLPHTGDGAILAVFLKAHPNALNSMGSLPALEVVNALCQYSEEINDWKLCEKWVERLRLKGGDSDRVRIYLIVREARLLGNLLDNKKVLRLMNQAREIVGENEFHPELPAIEITLAVAALYSGDLDLSEAHLKSYEKILDHLEPDSLYRFYSDFLTSAIEILNGNWEAAMKKLTATANEMKQAKRGVTVSEAWVEYYTILALAGLGQKELVDQKLRNLEQKLRSLPSAAYLKHFAHSVQRKLAGQEYETSLEKASRQIGDKNPNIKILRDVLKSL